MNNHIQLKKTRAIFGSSNFQRRAVAPVIATLLLVAIAVVGGSTIFVFSQGVFATEQICCTPHIELVEILGYDATDGNTTQSFEYLPFNVTTGDRPLNKIKSEEYIAVYVENHSVNKITLSEVLLAGEIFEYVDLGGAVLPDYTTGFANLGDPEYTIVKEGFDETNSITIDSGAPELQPGQRVAIILAMDRDVKLGRDLQIKLTTTHDSVWVGTIITGQKQVGFA